ncbi:hypothetical protein OAQ32_01155 [Flavobacteriaceae bacterium]|nr:hypothetical protein [Flavobacteriaceae bacterium]
MKYFFENIISLFKYLIGAAILGFFIDIVMVMISGVGLSLASIGNDIYGYESKNLLNFTYALPALLILALIGHLLVQKPIVFLLGLILKLLNLDWDADELFFKIFLFIIPISLLLFGYIYIVLKDL